jgi:hypothetical protein
MSLSCLSHESAATILVVADAWTMLLLILGHVVAES